jgi:nucleoside-diphosphate-sugar epimerase
MAQKKKTLIVVAGGTGELGRLIVAYLVEAGTQVRILTRSTDRKSKDISNIPNGVEIIPVDYNNPLSLTNACIEASCVVSALSGIRDVIVTAQTNLLMAAVEARVPRFIPSDYCIDYRKLNLGSNRNLDLRREFSEILFRSAIRATSVLNGMFTDLLIDAAPVVLFKQKRIFFWGNVDQKMDFTTMENTAQYTALVAQDDSSPRWLTIAGETASMRDLQQIATEAMGEQFRLLRPGGLTPFRILIKLTKTFSPGHNQTFPAWQGMQYLYDMLSGLPKFNQLDNSRYSEISWTHIKDVLKNKK